MAHDSSEHLQFDSRLANRKDWTDRKEWDRNLASLPDLSNKVEFLDDDSSEEESVEEGAEDVVATFETTETVETVQSTETVETVTESPLPPLGEPTHEL